MYFLYSVHDLHCVVWTPPYPIHYNTRGEEGRGDKLRWLTTVKTVFFGFRWTVCRIRIFFYPKTARAPWRIFPEDLSLILDSAVLEKLGNKQIDLHYIVLHQYKIKYFRLQQFTGGLQYSSEILKLLDNQQQYKKLADEVRYMLLSIWILAHHKKFLELNSFIFVCMK